MGSRHPIWRLVLLSVLFVAPLATMSAPGLAAADGKVLAFAPVDGGISLRLSAPRPNLSAITADGVAYTVVAADGMVASGEAGTPSLPVVTAWLVVPAEAKPTLTLLSSSDQRVTLPGPVLLVPHSDSWEGADAEVDHYDAAAASASGEYPGDLCEITGESVVREWRLVQVACHPYRYDRAADELVYTSAASLRLNYGTEAPADADSAAVAAASGDLLEQVVGNPEDLARFRVPAEAPLLAQASPAAKGRYRLMTDAGSALYAVTYEELIDAAVPVAGVDVDTLCLYQGGAEVAIAVEDDDGVFGAGDRIVFFAEERESVYGTANAYWLDWGSSAGLRVALRDLPAAGDSTAVHLLARATMRNYDPTYADPWRSDWTDVYLYEAAYSAIADDGHFYAGSIQVRSSADMPDREWFAVEVPGAADANGTLDLTFESLTAGAHRVDAWYGVIGRGGPYVSFLPGVLVRGGVGATVSAQGAQEPTYEALGALSWAGKGARQFRLTVPSGTGLHVLKLELAGQADGAGGYLAERAYVPSPTLLYPLAYAPDGAALATGQSGSANYALSGLRTPYAYLWDVTEPTMPVALAGYELSPTSGQWRLRFADTRDSAATYAVADGAGLKRVSGIFAADPVDLAPAAEYLIVCHKDFLAAANSLAAFRRSSGFRTRVVTTQQIYDRYSYGLLDSEAIRSFVYGDAYAGWVSGGTHMLQYLLLLGDGSFDFEDRLNHGEANYVPPYLVEHLGSPDWSGEAGADHRFANADASLPSVYVGRIPVRTSAQATQVIAKIMAYEAQGSAFWGDRALFAADEPDTSRTPALDFAALANDAIAAIVSDGPVTEANVTRVYQSASEDPPDGYYYSSGDDDTAAVLSAWRAGQGVAYYTGHSDHAGWAHPTLLDLGGVPGTANAPSPILVAMTCFTGSFYQATAESLDEALLLVGRGGTIGSLSPLSTASISGHEQMQRPILRSIYARDTLGEAMAVGKAALDSVNSDLLDTYCVLGDPALRLVGASAVEEYWVMLPAVAEALRG